MKAGRVRVLHERFEVVHVEWLCDHLPYSKGKRAGNHFGSALCGA
jgi:hypothetical protein